jgi:elongation of very long chain fatty acids protein 6
MDLLSHYDYSFEKTYDPVPVVYWMGRMQWFPILACALYGIGIVAGQKYFENRPRWNWKYTMAAWNLFLSTFSFIGVCRTLPPLITNITHMSLRDNMCTDPSMSFGCGSTGLWVQLFILSKFP